MIKIRFKRLFNKFYLTDFEMISKPSVLILLLTLTLHALGAPKNETTRADNTRQIDDVSILLGLATKVYSHNTEKSLYYAEAALKTAQKQNDKISEAKALQIIGDIYSRLDYHRLSLPYYLQSLGIAGQLKEALMCADLSIRLGDVYFNLNFNDSARINYNKAWQLYQQENNYTGVAISSLKLGNTYKYTTNYDKALDYYFKALDIYQEYNIKPGQSKVYNHIGSLYILLNDYKEALHFLEKSLSYFTDYDDYIALSDLYFHLGETYRKINNSNKALEYYKLAKSIYDSVNLPTKSAYVELYMAKIFYGQKNYTSAISMAHEAREIFERTKFNQGLAEAHNDLGKYYLLLEEDVKAEKHLLTAFDLLKTNGPKDLLKDTYLELSNLYQARNQYKKSLDYYKLYQSVNDLTLTHQKAARVAELQAKYESTRKEQEIIQKNVEITENYRMIKKQKITLYLSGFIFIIVLILSVVIFYQYRVLRDKGKKIERINAELDQRVKERTVALQLTQFSIEQAADPIFWVNHAGQFNYANNSACETLGYTKDELLRKKITDIISKFTLDDWNDFWEISKKEGSLVFEILFKRKGNITFPAELVLNYIKHEGQEYSFAFVRDISDRKQKEENLKKAKEKAEEADKLKSAFLANMSHEIRTPMNAIIGFSDMLIQEGFDNDERQEFANIIKSSGDTLLKLIDDIINISIIEAGQLKCNLKNFYLNQLLKEIHLSFQGEKQRLNKRNIDIKLKLEVPEDRIMIYTDKIRFQQILSNLLGNALKFTDNGYIEFGYSIINKKELSVYVKDTGIGIPKDKLSVIFERFNKLSNGKKLYSGTGLGLTISKRIVEQLGGKISVDSEPGKGSIFKFTSSYSTHQSEADIIQFIKPIDSSKPDYQWRNKSLLIVEDVESNYQYLATALKKTGVKIQWAKNGNDALKYCKSVYPDAILMDIQLPEKSGYETTREILDINPNIPIIAQTAYAFNDEKEKIIEAGCVAYITKPINTQILYETINKYIGNKS